MVPLRLIYKFKNFIIMLVGNCVFNDEKDLRDVDQFGFVDLVDCLSNGEVPSTLADSEDVYNGIEDPDSILGKPSDIFDAYKMQDYVKTVGVIKEDSVESQS